MHQETVENLGIFDSLIVSVCFGILILPAAAVREKEEVKTLPSHDHFLPPRQARQP